MVMTTEGPKVFDVSPVTGSPIYQTPSPRPKRTTPRHKFQKKKKDKAKKWSKQGGTGVANSYQQLGDQEEINVNLVYETTPGPEILPSSSIYQQIDGQVNVNISTPSDKAWLEVVTANPSLMQNPSPTPSPQLQISTTQKPSSSWKRQDSLEEQFEIEEVWREPQVTVTPRGAIPTMKGFMASQGKTKSPTSQPLVLGKRTYPTTSRPTTRYTSAPTRRPTPTPYYPSTPASSFSVNTGIKWGPPGKKINSRKDILSTLKANRKNWGKRRQNPKSSKASQRPKSKEVNLDQALEKLVPQTTSRPRTTSPSPAAWSATARPPPETITTPGWHIHSNANLPTQNTSPASADSRLDSFSTNQPTDATYVQISTQRPRPLKTRKKSKFHPKLKGRYKSKRKEDRYRRVHPHVHQFTSDDAISKSDVVPGQRPDTKLSASRPRLSVAAVPTKGGRLLDAAPSLLKHKVPQPRQKPLKKKGGWLLLGPGGASFHFDNLHQVLNLNQNNFVPG